MSVISLRTITFPDRISPQSRPYLAPGNEHFAHTHTHDKHLGLKIPSRQRDRAPLQPTGRAEAGSPPLNWGTTYNSPALFTVDVRPLSTSRADWGRGTVISSGSLVQRECYFKGNLHISTTGICPRESLRLYEKERVLCDRIQISTYMLVDTEIHAHRDFVF